MNQERSFRLDRRIPVALVFAFVLQTGGALFWAGSAAQRISEVERQTQTNASAVERVVRLEAQVNAMHEQLALKITAIAEAGCRAGGTRSSMNTDRRIGLRAWCGSSVFDVPVRFDSDALTINLESFNAGDIPHIPIVEVRV